MRYQVDHFYERESKKRVRKERGCDWAGRRGGGFITLEVLISKYILFSKQAVEE